MLFIIERSSHVQEGSPEPPAEQARWDDMHECWVIDIQTLEGLIALAKQENPRWHTVSVRAPVEGMPNGDLPYIEIDDTILDDGTGKSAGGGQ